MEYEDIKIGQKVVPHNKSTGCELSTCFFWNDKGGEEQGFLYVINKNEYHITCSNKSDNRDGNYFLPEDLELYEEGKTKDKTKNTTTIPPIDDIIHTISNHNYDVNISLEANQTTYDVTISNPETLGFDFKGRASNLQNILMKGVMKLNIF